MNVAYGKRGALSYREAIAELRKYKGIHFAPHIVDILKELYNRWKNIMPPQSEFNGGGFAL